jgi:DNA-binding ferritin-like protein
MSLHELFDKIAEEVEGYVDEIAERSVQLSVHNITGSRQWNRSKLHM